MFYDRDALMDAADVSVVVDYLGLDTKKMGNRIGILCPYHDDNHFGNCFLTDKGFYCYACNKGGSVIDIIATTQNVSIPQAMGVLADICGGKNIFTINDKNIVSDNPFIPLETQKFLGIINCSVYKTENIVPCFDYKTIKKEKVIKDNLFYIIQTKIISNPLRELYQCNYPLYEEIIRNKALEIYKKNENILFSLQNHNGFAYNYLLYFILDGMNIPVSDFFPVIRKNMNRAYSIYIEHGGEKFQKKRDIVFYKPITKLSCDLF